MKITNNTTPRQILFSELHQGDVFKYNGSYFMKSRFITSEGSNDFNSIGLSDGEFEFFDPTGNVYIVNNAELIIKD